MAAKRDALDNIVRMKEVDGDGKVAAHIFLNRRGIVTASDGYGGRTAVTRDGNTIRLPSGLDIETLIPDGKPALPYDAEVEYLESTGTQWIDTGIREVDGTFSSDITVMLTGGTNGDILSAWGTKSRFYPLAYISSNTIFACSFQGSWTLNNTANIANISLNTKYRVFSELGAQGAFIVINGQSNRVSRYDGYPTGSELAIFKRGGPGQTTYVKCKLYSLSIWINQILVLDFIPVRVGLVGYLYDKVSGQLFGNAGSGSFVIGPDAVKPYDAEVEYLRSNGGPYVCTGIVPSNATRWDMRFSLDTANAKMGVDVSAKRIRVLGSGSSFTATIQGVSGYSDSWNTGQTVNEISFDLPNKRVSVNGNDRTFTGSYVSNDLPLCLLGSAAGATSADARASTLYWCKIYTSGVLVRDYIPVCKSGIGYLYDKVSGQLFGNQGTGKFIYPGQ